MSRLRPNRRRNLTSHAGTARPAFVAFFLAAAFALLVLLAAPGQSAAMKGSFYQAEVAAKSKKCKKIKGKTKKAKKARTKCSKSARTAARKATEKAMRTERGLYGFGLKANRIPSRNGTLIWSKKTTTVDGAGRTDFVLYSSKSYPRNGKGIVSGTVSVPKGKAPRGGWPLISWAHGTTGLADQCAPSKLIGSDAYYGSESTELIEGWLNSGYAVLKTDYEGLGTPGIHPYLQGISEGRGVLDIVRASRQLSGSLSKNVAITGHSQGGHAALFAAGLAKGWAKDLSHKGTVAYAPAAKYLEQVPLLGTQPANAYGLSALATSILRGAVVSDSGIKPADILSEGALAIYPEIDEICYGEVAERFTEEQIGPGALLKADWEQTVSGQKFLKILGDMDPVVETNRKVLITQGLQDTTVLPFTITNLLEPDLSKKNPGLIEYIKYGVQGVGFVPDVFTAGPSDHSSILLDATNEVNAFLSTAFGRAP
jgi:hypothetical protein